MTFCAANFLFVQLGLSVQSRLVDSSRIRLCLKSQGSLNDLRSLPMFAEDTGAASSGCVDYYDGRETDNLNS